MARKWPDRIDRRRLPTKLSLADARERLKVWRQEYNCRPHKSLGNLTPPALAKHAQQA
ncbi:MAG: transposase [Betaproteobacteria bacterium]|nr:transposase [Betaproteobacteria bacterium]